jgi:YHS domain-containing protein
MKKGLLFLCALPMVSFFATTALGADGASQGSSYPLETCVVSGEKLGSMGKSFVHNYQGREVQFCCKACLKEFNKDPQKFLKKLDAATEKPKN